MESNKIKGKIQGVTQKFWEDDPLKELEKM